MKIHTVLTIILLCTNIIFSKDCDITCSIHLRSYQTVVGSTIPITLTMRGSEFVKLNREIVEDIDGMFIGNSIMGDNDIEETFFTETLYIYLEKVGKKTIGPYKLKIGDCEITTNSINIEVIEGDKDKYFNPKTIKFRPQKAVVKIGEIITIKLIKNFKKGYESLLIPDITYKIGMTSSSSNIKKGQEIIEESIELKISADKIGKYIINEKSFIGLSNNVKVEEFELIVGE